MSRRLGWRRKDRVLLVASILCEDRGHGSSTAGKSCCGVCFADVWPYLRRGHQTTRWVSVLGRRDAERDPYTGRIVTPADPGKGDQP